MEYGTLLYRVDEFMKDDLIYIGQFESDLPEGPGIAIKANETIFYGTFSKGAKIEGTSNVIDVIQVRDKQYFNSIPLKMDNQAQCSGVYYYFFSFYFLNICNYFFVFKWKYGMQGRISNSIENLQPRFVNYNDSINKSQVLYNIFYLPPPQPKKRILTK